MSNKYGNQTERRGNFAQDKRGFDWQLAQRHVIAGSPESVRQQIAEAAAETTVNYMTLAFSFGDLTAEQAERSAELFGVEVLPAVKASVDRDRMPKER